MLKAYKWYIAVGAFLVYSLGLWHVCKTYTKSDHKSDLLAISQKVIDTQEQRAELANSIGKTVEEKLAQLQSTQTTIHQKVIREIVKEPVYTECITTPIGVQSIEAAITAGQGASFRK